MLCSRRSMRDQTFFKLESESMWPSRNRVAVACYGMVVDGDAAAAADAASDDDSGGSVGAIEDSNQREELNLKIGCSKPSVGTKKMQWNALVQLHRVRQPRLAIACMTKNPIAFDTWLKHHRDLGICHFFLRITGVFDVNQLYLK